MNILNIDPGNTESAYVICDYDTLQPLQFDKIENNVLIDSVVQWIIDYDVKHVGIEYMQSYSMGVGKSVFETCYFIGELVERIRSNTKLTINDIHEIYRNDEKIGTCGTMHANDAAIRRFLIDTFAKFDLKNGRGTKDCHDWFYGFRKDIWQAYAQAYVMKLKIECKL